MADTYPPQVIALVEAARNNQSAAPELNRPFYNPELSAKYGLQAYNDSQIFKLRMACATSKMPGTIIPQSMVQADPLVSGKVCNRVLDVAAEYTEQHKNDVSNPNHLLAPFHVAAKVRDIPANGETAQVVLAYNTAVAYSRAGRRSFSNKPGSITIDTTLSAPQGQIPIKILSSKGLALDAAYSEAKAFTLFQGPKVAHELAILARMFEDDLEVRSNSCRIDGNVDRSDCDYAGKSKYAKEFRKVRDAAR